MRFRHAALACALAFTPFGTAGAAQPALITGKAVAVDGDTLDIGPVRIRLHGIDAPEAGQTCTRSSGRPYSCGAAAANALADLVEGRTLTCRAMDQDRYGRVIAICTAGGIDVNAQMVRSGHAFAFVRFAQDYVAAEKQARADGIGIWNGEVQPPWEYRADRWARAAAAAPGGCPVKGNISAKGERIYHTPWSPWYERTQIDETSGERWFCDEAQAIEAGWRPARFR